MIMGINFGLVRREIEDSEGEQSSKVVGISAVARKYLLVIRRKSSRKRSPDMMVDVDHSSFVLYDFLRGGKKPRILSIWNSWRLLMTFDLFVSHD